MFGNKINQTLPGTQGSHTSWPALVEFGKCKKTACYLQHSSQIWSSRSFWDSVYLYCVPFVSASSSGYKLAFVPLHSGHFLIFFPFALLIVSTPSQFYVRMSSSVLHPAWFHPVNTSLALILELPHVSQFRFLRKRKTQSPKSSFCMKAHCSYDHDWLPLSWGTMSFSISCVRLLVRFLRLALPPSAVPVGRPFSVRKNSVLAEMAIYT